MAGPLILAIDQGTSSTKCLVVDDKGEIVARGQAPVGQTTPHAGWVDQDPLEIWDSVQKAVASALTSELAGRVVSVGFSTQRESCLVWERASGEPLTPLLSWQDQRTESLCAEIRAAGHEPLIRAKSGLPLDPMFSAAKAKWLLDRIDPDRKRATAGEIVVGTIDSFLLSRFGGDSVVEAGNASRMQLVDISTANYDDELLALFDIPRAALPKILPSTGPFPAIKGLPPLADGVAVGAVLADSHAALFAHGAFTAGPVKATHGTGSSVMGLLSPEALKAADRLHPGLCLTVAWWIDRPAIAFEANIRSAGSTLLWAAAILGVDAADLAAMAATVADSGNVHLIPGFNGLGAPWWDGRAIATLSGMTFGDGREKIARAALDSIAHQIADVIDAVRYSGVTIDRLFVDGGPTRNDQLLQFEADITGIPVVRTETEELSALGAAYLAGLESGIFELTQLASFNCAGKTFEPSFEADAIEVTRRSWKSAVYRSLNVDHGSPSIVPDHNGEGHRRR